MVAPALLSPNAVAACAADMLPSQRCALIPLPWPPQGAETLLKLPAQPARLPFAADLAWQRALRKSLRESVTSLTDFLGHPWRPSSLPVDAHHVSGIPSQWIGCMWSLLYQEVMGKF